MRDFRGLVILPLMMIEACASAPVAAPVERAPPGAPVRKVAVKARQWEFDPEEIRMKQGEILTLTIESEDVRHGFRVGEIDLELDLLPGQPVEASLYGEGKGETSFRCSHFCGLGHIWMNGKIIVE